MKITFASVINFMAASLNLAATCWLVSIGSPLFPITLMFGLISLCVGMSYLD